jgi:hypothetical protein
VTEARRHWQAVNDITQGCHLHIQPDCRVNGSMAVMVQVRVQACHWLIGSGGLDMALGYDSLDMVGAGRFQFNDGG